MNNHDEGMRGKRMVRGRGREGKVDYEVRARMRGQRGECGRREGRKRRLLGVITFPSTVRYSDFNDPLRGDEGTRPALCLTYATPPCLPLTSRLYLDYLSPPFTSLPNSPYLYLSLTVLCHLFPSPSPPPPYLLFPSPFLLYLIFPSPHTSYFPSLHAFPSPHIFFPTFPSPHIFSSTLVL